MSFYLAVSVEQTELRPLARNFLRAAALLLSVPVSFDVGQREEIALSNGKIYPKGGELLSALGAVLPQEIISATVVSGLEALQAWLRVETELQAMDVQDSMTAILHEVERQTVFYRAEDSSEAFEDFWAAWSELYPRPQRFEILGDSVINEINRAEAEDYLNAHNRASAGVQSVDNAIDSLLHTIPADVERILDIGSGPGYVNRQIPADYSVLAMDIDESILKGNIRQTCVGDIMDIPLADRSVDLIMACDMLEHLPDTVLETGIKELMRVSRKYIYLQVPFQEDALMAMAYCGQCGHVWHVNHHKHTFNQARLIQLLSEDWKAVCINYTGDVSMLRTGVHETEFAQHLDWKVHCVTGAVCPNCGAESTIQGENELKLLHRLGGFDTEFPFPIYTEIGILFCRTDQTPQLPKLAAVSEHPQVRYRNILKPMECRNTLDVYTAMELMPCLYASGCTMEVAENGYRFRRTTASEPAWMAVAFPPLSKQFTGLEITASLPGGSGKVSTAMLDGSGQEYYLQDWQWTDQKAAYLLQRDIRCCPTLLKIYFTAEELILYQCKLTGGEDIPYWYYDREQKPLFVFSVENIRYQLRYPNPAGIIFSHLPEQWLQRNQQTSERRAWALQRLARTMNGEPDLLVDPWNDQRHLIVESFQYSEQRLKTVPTQPWSDQRHLIAESLQISAFAPQQNKRTELVYQDQRTLMMRHLENPLLIDLYHDGVGAESNGLSCDQRRMMAASLLIESKLLFKEAQSEWCEISLHAPTNRRGEMASTLFAEYALAVYGETAYGRWYSVKMRTRSIMRRAERKAVLWLHRHRSVYQLLTGLGVKRFYINCKRRKKK